MTQGRREPGLQAGRLRTSPLGFRFGEYKAMGVHHRAEDVIDGSKDLDRGPSKFVESEFV